MKKLLMALLVCLITSGVCYAEPLKIGDVVEKITLKQGIAFSLAENKLEYLTTIPIVQWKDFSIEGGYSSENSLIGVVSYPILSLKEKGVTIPILKDINCNIGIFFGLKRIENVDITDLKNAVSDTDFGISLTLFSLKW